MSKVNLYIDCTSGVSGDMLCQCLIALCGDGAFVEEQQQLISDELHHEATHEHQHNHNHPHDHDHGHPHGYTHRSFQSLLTLLSNSQLDEAVLAMTLKIYTILAIAEAQVHGETLKTVHFHEVGRPQAIINMVGIAAAVTAIKLGQIYCSKVIDGTGTVQCAHGEVSVPVPAVRALMDTSNLAFGTKDIKMEMVTPTGLAALLALEPQYMASKPESSLILNIAEARGNRLSTDLEEHHGLKILSFLPS